MAGPYTIAVPVSGQPISSSLFGIPVRDAINDLHTRTALIEANTQKMVKRGRRVTAKTGITTTETGVLRVDDVPVIAGGAYRIMTSNLNLDSTVANDSLTARMRVLFSASTGSPATTASPQIASMRNTQDKTTYSNLIPLSGFYFPGSSGFISVLISGVRADGTGTMQFFASAGEPLDLTIEYAGADPGDTGVIL